ncbi:PAS domain S-box protein [Alkalinema pantanalense CENA528]|uniref:PAS domain S-box protein n=1 Tax=Alkalinema pantanalense TaxID=1620705 RepID=UPI003D6F1734
MLLNSITQSDKLGSVYQQLMLLEQENQWMKEALREAYDRLAIAAERQLKTVNTRNSISAAFSRAVGIRYELQRSQRKPLTPNRTESIPSEQEQFLQSIYDGVDYPIFVIDVVDKNQFRYVGWNRSAERVSGLTSAEIAGKSSEEIYGLDAGTSEKQRLQQVIQTGLPLQYEESIASQGRLSWWMTTLNPLKDETGQVYRIIGTAFDWTDRKRHEEALRLVVDGTSASTGNEFFRSCVKFLAEALQMPFAFITEFIDETRSRARMLAVWAGEDFAPNFEYDLTGTPCAITAKDGFARFPKSLQTLFPEDQDLGTWGVDSYLSIALVDSHGHWLGTMGVLHTQPMDEQDQIQESILRIFAARVGAEIERKQTEAILRQQETQYRGIFETVTDGIVITDLETQTVVEANPAACRIYGYAYEALIGLDAANVVVPEYRFQLDRLFTSIHQGQIFAAESKFLRQNGSIFDVEVIGTPYLYQGKPHALSVVRDISDRKLTETALKKQQREFRQLAKNIPGILYQFVLYADGSQAFTYVSPRCWDIYEISPEVAVADPHALWGLVIPEDVSALNQSVVESAQSLQPWFSEHRIQTASGRVKWIQGRSIPTKRESGDIIWDGFLFDVTDRKEVEKALKQSESRSRRQAIDLAIAIKELKHAQTQLVQSEKMSSLGQLVAGVAHEINNPTSFIYGNLSHVDAYAQGVLGLLKLYQQHYPNPASEIQDWAKAIELDFLVQDFPKTLRSMQEGAERIKQIVLSLRTFSRLDEADCKVADLHEGLDSTLMILQHRLKANANKPSIQVEKAYGDLPPVKCYAGQLNQVFMNLLANAIDAVAEKFPKVDLEATEQPKITIVTEISKPGWVKIIIADNGVGIAPEYRSRLFDPFFTTKPVGQGTGMGLSISYQIVTEKHRGTLRCRSAKSGGAEFVIEIPIDLDTVAME